MPEAMSSRARLMAEEANKATIDPVLAAAGADAQAAQAATPLDSLTTVLGSSSGGTLRRIARDLDSTSLLLKLASPSARPVRRMAVATLSNILEAGVKKRAKKVAKVVVQPTKAANAAEAKVEVGEWPSSDVSEALEKRQATRAKAASLLLLRAHVDKQIAAGWRGLAAVAAFNYVILRIGFAALMRAAVRLSASLVTKVMPQKLRVAMAGAASFVVNMIGRELLALGGSMNSLGEELGDSAA